MRLIVLIFCTLLVRFGALEPALHAHAQGGLIQGEVKILDDAGILRASRPMKTGAHIELVISRPLAEEGTSPVKLVNTDGLLGERQVSRTSGERLHFEGVGAGTWRISGLPSGVTIERVTIRP